MLQPTTIEVDAPFAARTRDARLNLQDEFYCRPRRRRLQVEKCLDDYMNANAFEQKRSACFRCPQGCTVRRVFSEGE